MFPLGDSTKDQVRAEAARRGLAVADKPDSHDICFIADGDTRAFLRRKLGYAPRPDRRRTRVSRSASHDGSYGFTVGQRRGLRIDTPAATASRGTCWTSSRSPAPSGSARRGARRRRDHRRPAGLDRLRAPVRPDRGPGPAARARRDVPRDLRARRWRGGEAAGAATRSRSGCTPRPGASPEARPPSSTTARPSSAPAPSPRPPARESQQPQSSVAPISRNLITAATHVTFRDHDSALDHGDLIG